VVDQLADRKKQKEQKRTMKREGDEDEEKDKIEKEEERYSRWNAERGMLNRKNKRTKGKSQRIRIIEKSLDELGNCFASLKEEKARENSEESLSNAPESTQNHFLQHKCV